MGSWGYEGLRKGWHLWALAKGTGVGILMSEQCLCSDFISELKETPEKDLSFHVFEFREAKNRDKILVLSTIKRFGGNQHLLSTSSDSLYPDSYCSCILFNPHHPWEMESGANSKHQPSVKGLTSICHLILTIVI